MDLARRGTSARSDTRRRLIIGLSAVGCAAVATGCGAKLPSIPTPLAQATARRSEPAPLEPARAPTAPVAAVGATFGRVLLLEGVSIDHDVVNQGAFLRLWLHWQAVGAASEDWRSIGRLVAAGGRVIASEDDQIGGRRRFLTRWRDGERVVDEMRLRIAPNCPPGEYGLMVGVLRPDNQTAVPITARPSAAGFGQEDAVLVGTVVVQTG